MPSCSILSCRARKSKQLCNLTLHRFPKNEALRQKWLEAVGLQNINPEHQTPFVCSLHFTKSQFYRTLHVVRLRENAVPTLFNMELNNMDVPEDNLEEEVLLCCRGCLATDRRLFNIQDHNLANALARITGTLVFQDELPQHLCSYCCRLLLKCESFRDMCLHTQRSLTTELHKGMLNLDRVRKINRPFNHYIDFNICKVNTVQYIDLDNPPNGVHLEDLNVNLKEEPETVEGIDSVILNGDIKKELHIVVGPDGVINDAIKEEPEIIILDIDGIISDDIEEKLETIVGTNGIIDDVIEAKPEITTAGLDGILNKTDTKAGSETQTRLFNISVDKLKHVQNRARKSGNALKKKQEMVDTNVIDKSNDVRLKAEETIERLLKRKQAQIKITDFVTIYKNDDEPTELKKVRTIREDDKRELRKVDDDYMPDFDFDKFETANDVEIVLLTKEEQVAEIEARKATEEYKNAPYPCELCGKHYRTEDSYKNHFEKHSEKKRPVECPVCKIRFKFGRRLRQHHVTHRFKFVCKQCGFVSRNRTQARMHHQYHDGKKYECGYCLKVFSKSSTYLSHVRLAHKTLNTVCGMCGETFINVQQHMALVHGVALKKAHRECTTCKVTFVNTHALNKHKMAAGEDHIKMHPCVQCGDNFDSVDAMKIHDDKEHPKCKECNVTFLNASCFDTHVDRKHRGVGNHVAKKEKEANMRAKVLGRPLPYPAKRPKPNGEPRIAVCDHCGKIFKNPSLLVYHLRKLRGEKLKHACPHCPKSFYIKDSYEAHLRVHTGEKPFMCDHCGMAFVAKGNLKRHVLTVHLGINKKAVCDICGRVLTTPGSLKLHVRAVHNGEPWPRRVRKKKTTAVSESTDKKN